VISGEYFGWSYGWDKAGTLGFLVTSAFVALMYTTFIFSFTELTTAIRMPAARSSTAAAPSADRRLPRRLRHAGRVRVRAAGDRPGDRRLRQRAVPGVRAEVGRARRLPGVHGAQHRRHDDRRRLRARGHADRDLRALHLHGRGGAGLLGRRTSSRAAGPASDDFGGGAWSGIFAAIPFAIWFFLAIEGVAMAAEETKNPSRSVPIAYIGGILTLVRWRSG
jgi:ethanolamine permease